MAVIENGHANYGWANYRDNQLLPEMAELKNTKYGLTEIKVSTAGTTVWTTFKQIFHNHARNLEIQCGPLMA